MKKTKGMFLLAVGLAVIQTAGCSDKDPKKETATDAENAGDGEITETTDSGTVDIAPPQQILDLTTVPLPRFICRANPGTTGPGTDPCPPVPAGEEGNWVVRRLFEPELALDLVPPDMNTGVYCLYDWVGLTPVDLLTQQASLPTQDAKGGALAVSCEGDPPVVVPLSVDVSPNTVHTMAKDLYMVTAHQAGISQVCPANVEPIGAPVTVAVVDSVPTRADSPIGRPRIANTLHGTTMALLIRDFAVSQNGDCAASILQTLALDLRYDETIQFWRLDTEGGGSIGTPGSVALATWDAIRFWRKAAPTSKLIINYSIGWDPAGPLVGGDTLSSTAVKSALQAAQGFKALMFSASGNRVAGPTPGDGPMLPAGFEIGPDGTTCPSNNCQPLTYGVGAVEDTERLLALTRPGSVPRLVAWGFMAVPDGAHLGLDDPADIPYFVPLSGTSVATALVSAAAAGIWAAEPTLTTAQVYDRLVTTGVTMTGVVADVCPKNINGCPGASPSQLQVCRALDPTGTTPCVAAKKTVMDALALAGPQNPDQPLGTTIQVQLSAPCGPDYQLFSADPSTMTFHCPEKQIVGYESNAYVYPQPGDPGCDTCCLHKIAPTEWKLTLRSSPILKAGLVTPRLLLVDTIKKTTRAIDLGIPKLSSGEMVTVTGLSLDAVTFDQALLVSITEGVFGNDNVIIDVLGR